MLREDGSVVAAIDADAEVTTASVGKLFLLCEAAEQVADGLLDPLEPLDRAHGGGVTGSGLWHHAASQHLPLIDVCLLIAAVSDNLATNVLLHRIGLDAVADRARALGCERSRLHDVVRDERTHEHAPHLSTGTARELADVARRIHLAAAGMDVEGISPAGGALVEQWLTTGVDLSLVAAPFRLDPLEHYEGIPWALWSKTGSDTHVRADVGVVWRGPRFRAYAGISTWDHGDVLHDEPFEPMHALGRSLLQDLA